MMRLNLYNLTWLVLAVKKKIVKHREKVLRCDSVLQNNQFVKPVPSSILKKCSKNHKGLSKVKESNQDSHKDDSTLASDIYGMLNIGFFDIVICHVDEQNKVKKDTLASAVAEEMQKIYKNELGPEPVSLTVPGEAVAEEDVSLILFIYPITVL
ncbi:hypothetical protein SESBI_28968 [Sesbania bispinosa]|nr:hypothetical protein SESBI_28968 [Sesbania bispinosa]